MTLIFTLPLAVFKYKKRLKTTKLRKYLLTEKLKKEKLKYISIIKTIIIGDSF